MPCWEQGPEGHRKTLINGEMHLEDGEPSAAMWDKLLRHRR
jgi:hypothetical protein